MVNYEVVRSSNIKAPQERIHALINDFHEWMPWSPWEDIDPSMRRTFSGPDAGVGAHYAWQGNKKAGAGSMEIAESEPNRIAINLSFIKPFKSNNKIIFELEPAAGGTEVRWRMLGTQTGPMALYVKLFSMDKFVGKDFEKGLGKMKALAEKAS